MDWTEIVLGIIGLGGIALQAYISTKNKEDKDKREKRQTAQLDASTSDITKQIEANTKLAKENAELAKENHRLIGENMKLTTELKDRLAANDVATVSVVRNNLRDIYYKIRPYGMISDTDYRAVTELYNAYKSVILPDGHHPNSWCDALYEEMQTWKRVETYPNGMHHISTAPMELPKAQAKPRRAKAITK